MQNLKLNRRTTVAIQFQNMIEHITTTNENNFKGEILNSLG